MWIINDVNYEIFLNFLSLYVIAFHYLILMYSHNSTKYLVISIFLKILNYTFHYLCHDSDINIKNVDVLTYILIILSTNKIRFDRYKKFSRWSYRFYVNASCNSNIKNHVISRIYHFRTSLSTQTSIFGFKLSR